MLFFILILWFCNDQYPLLEQHGFLLLVILLLLFSSLHNMLLYTILHVMCHCGSLSIDYVDGEMLIVFLHVWVIYAVSVVKFCWCFLIFFFCQDLVKEIAYISQTQYSDGFYSVFCCFCFPYIKQNSDFYRVFFILL